MEELIGVASPEKNGLMSKDGFIERESIKEGTDLNTIKTPGYYKLSYVSDLINAPHHSGNMYGTLIVLRGYNSLALQFIVLHDVSKYFFRGEISSDFQPWIEVKVGGGELNVPY